MSTSKYDSSVKPSFQKVHYVLRPRKQIERKIIIELLQELQNKRDLNINEYAYFGLGSIYYYDFILFHKFLNITDMISLDRKPCIHRFEFNIPFDFVKFKNISTTDFLLTYPFNPTKNNITWFDYDSSLIFRSSGNFVQTSEIFDDISIIAKQSKDNDFFIITVEASIKPNPFPTTNARQNFINTFRSYLSGKYLNVRNITEDNYPYIIQNIIINALRNSEVGKPAKFRKLFSFFYQDSTPMYTLGGMFSYTRLSKRSLKNKFFQFNNDVITKINVPFLTYKEKLHIDQKVYYLTENIQGKSSDSIEEMAIRELGFELDCIELENYLDYYKYYPQYYEGLV